MIQSRVGVAFVDQDTEIEIKGRASKLASRRVLLEVDSSYQKRLATCRCHFGTLLSVRELSKLLVRSNHKHPVGVSVGEHAPSAKRQKKTHNGLYSSL
jgi:hypothetical protein